MHTPMSAKSRYMSFMVGAALGLGILMPAYAVHAEEDVAAPVVQPANTEASSEATGSSSPTAATGSDTGLESSEESNESAPAVSEPATGASGSGSPDSLEETGPASESSTTTASDPEAAQPAAAANTVSEEEPGAEAAQEYSVTINDRYFGETKLTVKSGQTIAEQYAPDFKDKQGVRNGTANTSWILLPSKFKNTQTNEVYTLAQLQELPVSADATYTVVNYIRRLPLGFYTYDARPTSTDFTLNELKIYKNGNASTGELVQTVTLPALSYTESPARDTSGGKASSRIGTSSILVDLEHLDETTDTAIKYYVDGDTVFPADVVPYTQSFTYNSDWGGFTCMLDAVFNAFYVSVSDSTEASPVTPNIDVEFVTFDNGNLGNTGEKLTYTRTVTPEIKGAKYQLVFWYNNGEKVLKLTKASGEVLEDQSVYTAVPELTIMRGPYRQGVYDVVGNYEVLGVSKFTATPQPMDGYRLFKSGDGLTYKTPVVITYIREITLTYNFGEGTGSADPVTVLHRTPLKNYVGEFPAVEAPEGYTFEGWKINGEGDVITPDYIPMVTDPINLVATFKEKPAPGPDPVPTEPETQPTEPGSPDPDATEVTEAEPVEPGSTDSGTVDPETPETPETPDTDGTEAPEAPEVPDTDPVVDPSADADSADTDETGGAGADGSAEEDGNTDTGTVVTELQPDAEPKPDPAVTPAEETDKPEVKPAAGNVNANAKDKPARKQIAKTADVTPVLPALASAMAGAVAVLAGACAAATVRLRKRG